MQVIARYDMYQYLKLCDKCYKLPENRGVHLLQIKNQTKKQNKWKRYTITT